MIEGKSLMKHVQWICIGTIVQFLSGCAASPPNPNDLRNHLAPFDQAVSAFSKTLVDSKSISEFKEKYGSKPTIEIGPSKGLTRSAERFVRHQLIRNLLVYRDKISLVIGPGGSRRTTSSERLYLMRHGKMTDTMPLPGHVTPANFMILLKAGRDMNGDNWVWLTLVRLDNNQIITEKAVPVVKVLSLPDRFARPQTPTMQRVRFRIISDLSYKIGVWVNPTFPTFGVNNTGTIPSNIQPTFVVNKGSLSVLVKFEGYRQGTLQVCIEGVLYKNVCRKYSIPYNNREGASLKIIGLDQYGFIIARQIPKDAS